MKSSRDATSRPLIHKILKVSELRCMRSLRDRTNNGVSRLTSFARMDLNHINSRREKMIDICCVGSGVKYHSLFHWSIVMTSPIEFSTDEFSAKQV